MDLFVDAYDWVMVPNVYGMSQFADGGLFTTKPYLSGSNYVRKMSDYPKGSGARSGMACSGVSSTSTRISFGPVQAGHDGAQSLIEWLLTSF